MTEPTIENLAQRLDQVERDKRLLKMVGAVALAVIAVVVLMGQAPRNKVAKVVEAESFVVRDSSGQRRIVLEVERDGTVAISLFDRDGTLRTGLTVASSGAAGMFAFDRSVSPRIGLVANPDGSSGLVFFGDAGKLQVRLGMSDDKAPALTFYDKEGQERIGLGVSPAENSTLALNDRYGRLRAAFSVEAMGIAYLGFRGADGAPRLILNNNTRDEASLQVLEKGGKFIWGAPPP